MPRLSRPCSLPQGLAAPEAEGGGAGRRAGPWASHRWKPPGWSAPCTRGPRLTAVPGLFILGAPPGRRPEGRSGGWWAGPCSPSAFPAALLHTRGHGGRGLAVTRPRSPPPVCPYHPLHSAPGKAFEHSQRVREQGLLCRCPRGGVGSQAESGGDSLGRPGPCRQPQAPLLGPLQPRSWVRAATRHPAGLASGARREQQGSASQ